MSEQKGSKVNKIREDIKRFLEEDENSFVTAGKKETIKKADFDLIILTECWLSCSGPIPLLESYSSHATKQTYNQSDGILIYIKDNLKCTVEEPTFQEANCLIIKFGTHTVVIGIYRPYCSKNDATKKFSSLNQLLTELKCFKNIVLMGDINIDISPGNMNQQAEQYLNLTASHGLLPAFTSSTRMFTCIDHLSLKIRQPTKSFVILTCLTDHEAVSLSLKIKQPKCYFNRCIRKIDHVGLKQFLLDANFGQIYDNNNPEELANFLVETLSK
ncbi:unnamed protein product [Parnassius apollo]|uniref:(apollo) hypothetical protein n=1 Tax=Parnassius apollo TaxID=110799 RepID=A0A8S3WRS3_PARAO|nr:unnamed protein product [Parnassius apollo]